MGRAGPGPVDYGFDRAGPGLGLEYMGLGWSGPRVGEPVANTGLMPLPELGHNFEHGQALSILNCPSGYRPAQQEKIGNRSVSEHNPYLAFHGAKYLPRSDRNV